MQVSCKPRYGPLFKRTESSRAPTYREALNRPGGVERSWITTAMLILGCSKIREVPSKGTKVRHLKYRSRISIWSFLAFLHGMDWQTGRVNPSRLLTWSADGTTWIELRNKKVGISATRGSPSSRISPSQVNILRALEYIPTRIDNNKCRRGTVTYWSTPRRVSLVIPGTGSNAGGDYQVSRESPGWCAIPLILAHHPPWWIEIITTDPQQTHQGVCWYWTPFPPTKVDKGGQGKLWRIGCGRP